MLLENFVKNEISLNSKKIFSTTSRLTKCDFYIIVLLEVKMNQKGAIVKKHNYFIDNVEPTYELNEVGLNLLAKMASLAKKKDKDLKPFTFEVKALLEELNLKENHTYLKVQTRKLLSNVREWVDEEGKTKQSNIFYLATYSKDNKYLTLQIHPEHKKFFIQLKKFFTTYRYLEYRALKTRYAKKLFELIHRNRYKPKLEKSLEELKNALGVKPGKYKKWIHFKDRVLEPSIVEIHKKTFLRVAFEPIKEKKKVVALCIYFQNKANDKSSSLFRGDDLFKILNLRLEEIEKQRNAIVGQIDYYSYKLKNKDNPYIKFKTEEEREEAEEELIILERNLKKLDKEKTQINSRLKTLNFVE